MRYVAKGLGILSIVLLSAFTEARAGTVDNPTLPEVIDLCTAHAGDQFEQMKDQGRASGLSEADQKWLETTVNETGKKLDDAYAKLKTTQNAANREAFAEISDSSDNVPYNLLVKLTTDRKDLADQLGPKAYFRTGSIVALVMIQPQVLDAWLEGTKVSKPVRDKLHNLVETEIKHVTTAGQALGESPNSVAAWLDYSKAKTQARHAIWDGIATSLTMEQRRSLARAMDETSGLEEFKYTKTIFAFRETRRWVSPKLPAEAKADSDQMNSFEAAKPVRVSLIEAADKIALCTADLQKGQKCGFDFHEELLATRITASAGDQSVAIEPGKHLYCWIIVGDASPLSAAELQRATKSYTSKSVPIRLELPRAWTVDDDAPKRGGIPQMFSVIAPDDFPSAAKGMTRTAPCLSVIVFHAGEEKTIDDVVKQNEPPKQGEKSNPNQTWTQRQLSIRDVTLDGEPAAWLQVENLKPANTPESEWCPSASTDVIVLHKDLIFRISMTCAPEDIEQTGKILSAIVESAKFVDDHLDRWQTGEFDTRYKPARQN